MVNYVVCLTLFPNLKVLVLAEILDLPCPNIFKDKLTFIEASHQHHSWAPMNTPRVIGGEWVNRLKPTDIHINHTDWIDRYSNFGSRSGFSRLMLQLNHWKCHWIVFQTQKHTEMSYFISNLWLNFVTFQLRLIWRYIFVILILMLWHRETHTTHQTPCVHTVGTVESDNPQGSREIAVPNVGSIPESILYHGTTFNPRLKQMENCIEPWPWNGAGMNIARGVS